MWWSDRRRALLLIGAGLLLGGCFRPMLAADAPTSALIGRIAFPTFDDRFGYHLNDSLRARLGRTSQADYRLEVKTRMRRENLAITQDNAVTRISLTATADWALYRADGTEPVLIGEAVSQSGYNSTASLFATREAQRDIERRLARDLGERIARALLAQAAQVAGGAPGTAGS